MSGRAFKQKLDFLFISYKHFEKKSSKLTIDFQVIFDGVKNQCNKNKSTITICLHLKIRKQLLVIPIPMATVICSLRK